jgi:cobalt-zinc-cadmium efflux system protein
MSGVHHRTAGTLLRCLLLTLGFAGVEAIAGWWSGSLALVSDAGHMVADGAGLGLALLAASVAARAPSKHFTYGLGRVEVVAAVVNALVLVALVVWIVTQAILRLRDPHAVEGWVAVGVAAFGLGVNLVVARLLSHGEQTLNTRAAFLHVLGDMLGSFAAILSGIVILLTGWTTIDPVLSLVICALIVVSAARILLDGLRILLEGVPAHLNLEEIGRTMAAVPGVASVHDLHVWQLSSAEVALSAHVVLEDPNTWESVLTNVRNRTLEAFGIGHVTLQPARRSVPVQIETPWT